MTTLLFKKFKTFLSLFIFLFFVFNILAIESALAQNDTHPENASMILPEGVEPPEGIPVNYNTDGKTVNKDTDLNFCQNQYKTISVLVKVDNITKEIVPGDVIQLKGNITNTNEYPVVNTEVLVKIIDISNGNNVIQAFSAKDNLSLLSNISEPFTFKWKVPEDISKGEYEMNFFVRSFNKFDVSGVSSSHNISAGALGFSILDGKIEKNNGSTNKTSIINEFPLSNFKLPVVMKYPLEAGKENTLFSCLYNIGVNATTTPNSRLVLTLKDEKGNVIYSFTKETVSVGLHLARGIFTSKENYKTFSLEAESYKDGKIIDRVIINYDCGSMGSCQKSSTVNILDIIKTNIVFTIIGIIFILAGTVRFFFRKRKSIGFLIVLGFVLTFMLPIGLQSVNAQTNYTPSIYTSSDRGTGWIPAYRVFTEGFWVSGGCSEQGCDPDTWYLNGKTTAIGTHNRCVLTGHSGDAEGGTGCYVFGTVGGSWSVRVADEGYAQAAYCNTLCSDINPTGTPTGYGAACTALATGKAGVMNSGGNCCTGTFWHDIYYGTDISCTTPTTPPVGTISVSSNIPSSWTTTGPATIIGSGTSQSSPAQPVGMYTITWNDVARYTKSTSQSLTLISGGTITFNGVYTTSINLVSQNLSVPASATSGTALNFTADVRNIGTADTGEGFDDNFSYQWNGTGGVWIDIPFITKTALASGGVSEDPGSYTPTQTGTLYIQHCVDSANVVNEGTDETPNCTASEAITVASPPNIAPTASITIPAINITIPENQAQQFTGNGTDTDGTIVAYEWRTNDCVTGTLLSSLASFVESFIPGTYNVYLRVQDNNSLWSTNCPYRTIDATPNNQIPGVCGSANGVPKQAKPTSNLCDTVGLPSPTVLPSDISVLPESGTPSSWTWTCSGENGGATAFCSSDTSCGDNKCQRSKGESPATCRADCRVSFFEF